MFGRRVESRLYYVKNWSVGKVVDIQDVFADYCKKEYKIYFGELRPSRFGNSRFTRKGKKGERLEVELEKITHFSRIAAVGSATRIKLSFSIKSSEYPKLAARITKVPLTEAFPDFNFYPEKDS